MHTVSQDLFDEFKSRAMQTDSQTVVIDQRISNLCKAFNHHQNVATTWSCSGHTFSELKSRYTQDELIAKKISVSRRWYLAFVLTGNGVEFIEKLQSHIFSQPDAVLRVIRPQLCTGTLANIFKFPNNRYYNTWILEGSFKEHPKHIDALSVFWKELAESISQE